VNEEAVVEAVETVEEVLSDRKIQMALVGGATFVGGLVIGYFIGKSQGKTTVIVNEEPLADDLEELPQPDPEELTDLEKLIVEEGYSALDDDPEYQRLLAEEAEIEAAERQDIMEDEDDQESEVDSEDGEGSMEVVEVVEEVVKEEVRIQRTDVVHSSVFAHDDDWDYEQELAKRDPEQPYILHKDEFFEGEKGFPQITLTYYQGDDILVDDHENIVPNAKTVVGEMKFGHGSGDRNVVYVRNEVLGAEYEVLLSQGEYTIEVLGLEAEAQYEKRDGKQEAPRFRGE
jgi:hypothetical protein